MSEQGSPCQYDEGSPLVQSNVVIGIMSNRLGCTFPSSTIFTRVSAYYPWYHTFLIIINKYIFTYLLSTLSGCWSLQVSSPKVKDLRMSSG